MVMMTRLVPATLALMLALPIAGCGWRFGPAPSPPPVQQRAGNGLLPVAGEWQAGKESNLRAAPTTSSAVVGRLRPGQPVAVQGRVANSDWFAVSNGGGTAYVRLDLLDLKGTERATPRGTTSIMPKPADNDGPAIKAAPRGKVQAAPIKGSAIPATPLPAPSSQEAPAENPT